MNINLLEALVCPKCKGALLLNVTKTGLICKNDNVFYPIKDNIPVLLREEAIPITDETWKE